LGAARANQSRRPGLLGALSRSPAAVQRHHRDGPHGGRDHRGRRGWDDRHDRRGRRPHDARARARHPEWRHRLRPARGRRRAPAPPAGPAAKSATTGALALEIGEIVVEQGRVRFDDASVAPPARLRVGPIALTANEVTWPGRQPARVKLSASTPEAGTFDAEGTVALDPVRFELRARVAGVTLAPYRSYVPLTARLQGRLEADMALKGRLGETMQL